LEGVLLLLVDMMLMGRAKKKGREIETQQTLKCRDNKDGGVEKEDVARGERALAKRVRAANLMAVPPRK
jgi:hypothetical protein